MSSSQTPQFPPGLITVGPTTLHQAVLPTPSVVDDDDMSGYTKVGGEPATIGNKRNMVFYNPRRGSRQTPVAWNYDWGEPDWEPNTLTTTYYATTPVCGRLIRDAAYNCTYTNSHRVGTKFEDETFKVRMVTGKRNTGTLYYSTPESFERSFYHGRVSIPENEREKWYNKCNNALTTHRIR
jgi:hypothetical protein